MTMRCNSEIGWKKHPCPQMRRELFHILEEGWRLNGKEIRVPFPPEAPLSGYEEELGTKLCYEVLFSVPEIFTKEKILLRFGAVDQVAEVWLNGHCIGMHEGGYLPFFFDVTEVVSRKEENRLEVKVTDELSPVYPYGKQSKAPGGMWYTPVSGIWQNVWLENVPECYIEALRTDVTLDGVTITLSGAVKGFTAIVSLGDGETCTKRFDGNSGVITLAEEKSDSGKSISVRHWTPETPYLYPLKIVAGEDEAETYFALRTVRIEEVSGRQRVCLNGTPVFLHGVLDQGYFPGGIYLPSCEEEYEREILRMKELGINLLRKHCKVEPEWFYYYCDLHGMLVLQDMVNSGSYAFLRDTALPTVGFRRKSDKRKAKKEAERKRRSFFERHMKETIAHLYNHPCVIGYTIFNEGWGQFESDRMYRLAKEWDGSRLYDATSGWFAGRESDFDSEHVYFRNKRLKGKVRPLFLSECGGFSYQVTGHCHSADKTYGYGTCRSKEELTERIVSMYRSMVLPAIKEGLCGCVYTQVSDVEEEINGLYTYDREVCKVDKAAMERLAAELREALLKVSG